jgi:hypothetical protein
MTRKHFEAIAATIKNTKLSKPERLALAHSMADTFAEINPRFKKHLFIAACGIDLTYVTF